VFIRRMSCARPHRCSTPGKRRPRRTCCAPGVNASAASYMTRRRRDSTSTSCVRCSTRRCTSSPKPLPADELAPRREGWRSSRLRWLSGLITVFRFDAAVSDRVALGIIVMALTLAAAWRMFRALRAYARSEETLTHAATHDALTGLPNRGVRARPPQFSSSPVRSRTAGSSRSSSSTSTLQAHQATVTVTAWATSCSSPWPGVSCATTRRRSGARIGGASSSSS